MSRNRYRDLTGRPPIYSRISQLEDDMGLMTRDEMVSMVSTMSFTQANSDWNASTGVTQILNKPTLASIATTGLYSDLIGKPVLASVAISGSYSDLTDKPTLRRSETYSGVTNASGNYSVTYSTPFSVIPDVQPQLTSGTPSQVVRIVSNTVSGFTVNVTNRASVTLLAVEVLLAATTPVAGAPVSVLVTAR